MIKVRAVVKNIDKIYARYVVARLVDGEFWFWGQWDDKDKANSVAGEFENGVVFDTQEV